MDYDSIFNAAMRAPFVPLWDLSISHYFVPVVLMLPAFILFVGGAVSPNPLLRPVRAGGYAAHRPAQESTART